MTEKKKENLFGENLKRVLKERRKKQKDLAEALGVAEQQISLYVNGNICPSWDRIFIISDLLGVEASELLSTKKTAEQISIGREICESKYKKELFDIVKDLSDEKIKVLIDVSRGFR